VTLTRKFCRVSRVLLQAGLRRILQQPKRSKADPFLPFIRATLERFPTLTASRLYAIAGTRLPRPAGPLVPYSRLPCVGAAAPASLRDQTGWPSQCDTL
jgi:hypothetical protein